MFGGGVIKIYRIKEFERYNSLNIKINKKIINIIIINVNIINKKIININNVFFVICIIMVLFLIFSFNMIEIFIVYI